MSDQKRYPPRLLSARPGADYVQNSAAAMRGEPEAIGEADLAAYVADAHGRDDAREEANKAALTAAMLARARQVAERFRVLRDAVHSPEARTSRAARNLARRIDRDLERLADELEHPSRR